MYKLSDISIVIPTYNRPEELKETLIPLKPYLKKFAEIIVVDQSKDYSIKNIVKSIKNKKVKYIFSSTPSITIARNLGVLKASEKSKIILFLDDDVSVEKNYFEEILKVFNRNPDAKGVAGVDDSSYNDKEKQSFSHYIFKRIFFLGHYEKDKARILSAYGNTYPSNLKKVISAEWLPGLNTAYKKSVFREQKFDENLMGYTVAEDIDFSYRLFRKHKNCLYITPSAKLKHRVSKTAREHTEKLAYINQVDHFYFNFKNLNSSAREKLIFLWSLLGISLLRTAQFLLFPNKNNANKMKFFFSSLFYAINNIEKIKEGRLRDFISIL